MALIQGPTGATADRTLAVVKKVEDYFHTDEKANVQSTFGVAGFSFAGQGQNMGLTFIRLNDWSQARNLLRACRP